MVPSENHFSKENDTQTCSIESMHHFFMDSNTQTINYTLKGLSHLCTFKNLPQNHLNTAFQVCSNKYCTELLPGIKVINCFVCKCLYIYTTVLEYILSPPLLILR